MTNYRLSLIVSLSSAICLNSVAVADDVVYKLDKINSFEQYGKLDYQKDELVSNPATAKLAVEKLGREEIDIINPKTVYDILNMSSASNMQFQGRKDSNIIVFRGSNSDAGGTGFGVIVDGVPLSGNTATRFFSAISVEDIESIEIIRDATALTLAPISAFGSPQASPIYGYIVVKTKIPTDNRGLAKLSIESYNTQKATLSYGGMSDKYFYLATFDGVLSDGKDELNNGIESGSGFLKLGYVNDGFNATLSGFFSRAFKEIHSATDSASMFKGILWRYEPIENSFVTLSLANEWNKNNKTSLQISKAKTSWHHDQDIKAPDNISYFVGSQTTDSVDLRHAIKIDNTVLKFGTQAMFYDSPNGELFYEGFERKEQLYGAFVQATHSLLENKLTLDETIRVDKKHIDTLLERYSPNIEAIWKPNTWQVPLNNSKLSIIEDTWAKSANSFSLGALYKFDDALEASARFMYATSGVMSGSKSADGTTLEDEEHFRYELGIKKIINEYLNPKVTLFYYDIKNLNHSLYGGTQANPVIVFEQEDQKRYGGELGVDGELEKLYYNFSYAYVDANRFDNEFAKHITSLLLKYDFANSITANLSAKYISEYESNFFTKDYVGHKVGDFTLVNIGVDYKHKISNYDAKLSLYTKNLLDEKYQTRIGWEDAGLIVGATYGIKF